MKTSYTLAVLVLFGCMLGAPAKAEPVDTHNTIPLAQPAAKPSVKTKAKAKSADEDYQAADYNEDNDPIEPVNRVIFKFNTVIDNIIIHPVASGYRAVIPQWGRQRVSNVFYNFSEPVTVVNSVLQADPENAFTSLWRFIINSTFGILGIFDPASDIGLKARQEDFGQTLGAWGYTDSPYLVLPLLGPSTLRDGIGLGVDYYTNPFYNGIVFDDSGVRLGLLAVRFIDIRTNLLDITDEIDRTSLDRYATYRSAFLQKRAHDINNGKDSSN